MNSTLSSLRARPRAAGFTLIELLTVIAIIGILAAIIIPVTGKVRATARSTRCKANLREIGTAMFLHATDNKNRFPVHVSIPPPAQPANVTDPLLPTSQENWMRAVGNYASITSKEQINHILCCPNVVQEQSATLNYSYAMNWYLAGIAVSRPTNPSQIVLIRHTGQSRSAPVVQGDNAQAPLGGLNYSDGNGKFNYVFADGHVATHQPLLPFADHWYVR